MKLQGFSIIFGLIMLPIILVLSYYLQLQVKTITLQSAYDSKLLDATYDAVQAFEINTANEDLSSVADSLRSIIEASNNIFFNTLATNMGLSNASKSRMQAYVPAILYTLYDGYYIYSPTEVPDVLEDLNGQAVVVDAELDDSDPASTIERYVISTPGLSYGADGYYHYDSASNAQPEVTSTNPPPADYGALLYRLCEKGTKKPVDLYTPDINYGKNPGQEGVPYEVNYNIDYVLKSYMPYAAKYYHKDGSKEIDMTIGYTLDNFFTVAGSITEPAGKIYYTKSGYFIDTDRVSVETTEAGYIDISKYNQNEAGELIRSIKELKSDSDYDNDDDLGKIRLTINVEGSTVPLVLDTAVTDYDADNNMNRNKDELYSALEYYTEALIFSNWVKANLGSIKASDIVENHSASLIATEPDSSAVLATQTTNEHIYDFKEDDFLIFQKMSGGGAALALDPEDDASYFQSHKRKVMRNMIQYNLNLAMSLYSASVTAAYSYQMPVLSEQDWEIITSRLSVVSFMQGLKTGLKVYSGYACAYSTNNELTVIPEEIYYVDKYKFDIGNTYNHYPDINPEDFYYHRADCPDFRYGASINPDDPSSFSVGDSTNFHTGDVMNPYRVISFTSKEVKYDKLYDKYENIYNYDHRNLACYRCILDNNYTTVWDKFRASADATTQAYYAKRQNSINLMRAIGLAKERNDIYKSYNINVDEGYQIIYNAHNKVSATTSISSARRIEEIKRIEVVFDIVSTDMVTDRTVYFVLDNGSSIPIQAGKNSFSLNLNQSKEQSISIAVDPMATGSTINYSQIHNNLIVTNDLIDRDGVQNRLRDAILYIKVIYK